MSQIERVAVGELRQGQYFRIERGESSLFFEVVGKKTRGGVIAKRVGSGQGGGKRSVADVRSFPPDQVVEVMPTL